MEEDNYSEQQNDYRQNLGLKKILYKYDNENQQLRTQIKALNERLNNIMNKPKESTKNQNQQQSPIQEFQGKMLKDEMERLFKEINRETLEMKMNKDGIDERHEQKCLEISNRIAKQTKEVSLMKSKLEKYDQIDDGIKLNSLIGSNQSPSREINPSEMPFVNKTLQNSTVRIQNYQGKLNSILEETETVRKSIKELERQRYQNDKNLVKKQMEREDVKQKNKEIVHGKPEPPPPEQARQRKGVWGMKNTRKNHEFISKQIQFLKGEYQEGHQIIRKQNDALQSKINKIKSQIEDLHKSVEMNPLPYQKKQTLKISQHGSLLNDSINDSAVSASRKWESPLMNKSQRYELEPLEHVPAKYSNNDKNFSSPQISKKSRKIVWQSVKNKSGIQWHDSKLKSVIQGVNLWFDGNALAGIQFIQELGTSAQHLHLMGDKKIQPTQYRLSGNDYIENVVLYIVQGFISGLEFFSKNGKVDFYGQKGKGKKFDFGIKKPEKPLLTLGQFKVNNNVSQITKLGFELG